MNIETLYFDFGNVIGFFDHRRATRQLAKLSDLAEVDLFDAIYGTQLEEDFENGRISTKDFIQRACATIHYRGTPEQFRDAFVNIFEPNPDVCTLIEYLDPQFKMILASNTNELHAQFIRKTFAKTLGHFDALGLSYQAKSRKPHPDFFRYCQGLGHSKPERCVFVDDITMHVEAARAFGWHGIHYTTYPELIRELNDLGIQV